MSIATTVATNILQRIIQKKLENPNVPVPDANVEVVARAAAQAAAPTLVHATNNEPWFQSRVTLGSGFAVLTSLGVVGGMFTGNIEFDIGVLSANLATLLGAGFALYGRWAAKKPLGQ